MQSRERHRLAPSRRSLSGLLAAVVVAPAAIAIPAAGAPALSLDPDADLIALGRELEAAWADERATMAVCGDGELTDEVLDAVCGRSSAVVDRIEALPATTLAGLKVKLRALEWCMTGDEINMLTLFDREEAATNIRLVVAILNDLRIVV